MVVAIPPVLILFIEKTCLVYKELMRGALTARNQLPI